VSKILKPDSIEPEAGRTVLNANVPEITIVHKNVEPTPEPSSGSTSKTLSELWNSVNGLNSDEDDIYFQFGPSFNDDSKCW
jgi:hypothetical protein